MLMIVNRIDVAGKLILIYNSYYFLSILLINVKLFADNLSKIIKPI